VEKTVLGILLALSMIRDQVAMSMLALIMERVIDSLLVILVILKSKQKYYQESRMQKASKTSRTQAHTNKSPKGMGDYYGTGMKQPLGKMREGLGMVGLSKKKLGKPPKSLA
jgi:hypothetical protein